MKVAGEAAEVPSKIFIALRIFIQPQPSFSNLFVARVRNGLNNNEPDQMKCRKLKQPHDLRNCVEKFRNAYIESQIKPKSHHMIFCVKSKSVNSCESAFH